MNINLSNYRIAQRIFYNLLKNGELREKDNKDLYLSYINDNNVREALECIEEESKVKIKHSNGIIYLIPNIDNDILGFNLNECKNKSLLGDNQQDVYLSYLIMTIIFAEFTNELSPATYIEIPSIISLVQESLDRSISKENIEKEEQSKSFNVQSCKKIWDAKPKWDEYNKIGIKATSAKFQIGYIRRIISFLSKQKLVNIISGEDKITPSRRFKDLMNIYFLDEDRKMEIENLLCLKENDICLK